jgi:hypothetical protein
MSTRSTTHFIDSSNIDPKTGKAYVGAIAYRHSDGYPSGNGRDLWHFITLCKKLKDSRLYDSSYLAAKFVVYLAEEFATDYMFQSPDGKLHKHFTEGYKSITVPRKNRLEFISVGIMMSDPWDIEYRYTVDCGKIDPKTKRPEVRCFKVSIGDDGNDKTCEEVPIPGFTKVPTTQIAKK